LKEPLVDEAVQDGGDLADFGVKFGKFGGEDGLHAVGEGLLNLRDSAVNAVLQWQYKPTLVNGVAVEVDTTVSLVFPPLVEPSTEHK
jgi:hypothetical protein